MTEEFRCPCELGSARFCRECYGFIYYRMKRRPVPPVNSSRIRIRWGTFKLTFD